MLKDILSLGVHHLRDFGCCVKTEGKVIFYICVTRMSHKSREMCIALTLRGRFVCWTFAKSICSLSVNTTRLLVERMLCTRHQVKESLNYLILTSLEGRYYDLCLPAALGRARNEVSSRMTVLR